MACRRCRLVRAGRTRGRRVRTSHRATSAAEFIQLCETAESIADLKALFEHLPDRSEGSGGVQSCLARRAHAESRLPDGASMQSRSIV